MPACRLCAGCGQPVTGRALCPTCRNQRYGTEHQTERARWQPHVATGTIPCARCRHPIDPTDPWDLDHVEGGRHPAHASCNRRAPRGLD